MNKLSSNRRARWSRAAALAILVTTFVSPVTASVVMNGTRFVYREGEGEIAVKVSNVGNLPALTQAWIDDGNESATPEMVDVPFNLTPPIARVETGKSQTLRVAYTGGDLPGDRESQFWINVLEVPPKADNDTSDNGQVQLAFRYRLKLFYRPKGLAGSPEAAARDLRWSVPEGGGIAVGNDSAYHVTVNDVRLTIDGTEVAAEPFAIAPHGTFALPLKTAVAAGSRVAIDYQSINDYGGFIRHTAATRAHENP